MTVLTSKERTARKEHRCSGDCWEPILPGTVYLYQSGVQDGSMWSAHVHVECHALQQAFWESGRMYDSEWWTVEEILDNHPDALVTYNVPEGSPPCPTSTRAGRTDR